MLKTTVLAIAITATIAPAAHALPQCYAETSDGQIMDMGHLCPNPLGQRYIDNAQRYRREASRLDYEEPLDSIDTLERLGRQLRDGQRPYAGQDVTKVDLTDWEWALGRSWGLR